MTIPWTVCHESEVDAIDLDRAWSCGCHEASRCLSWKTWCCFRRSMESYYGPTVVAVLGMEYVTRIYEEFLICGVIVGGRLGCSWMDAL